ncbi:MAG: hypothetical protein ACRDQA_02370 [Nocardioidaceae bacterium]
MTSISNSDAAERITARKPFYSHSRSLAGLLGPGSAQGLGALPAALADQRTTSHTTARVLLATLEQADYVVYSYATPIAWHHPEQGWVAPDLDYSATTSKHQAVVAGAIAGTPTSALAADERRPGPPMAHHKR